MKNLREKTNMTDKNKYDWQKLIRAKFYFFILNFIVINSTSIGLHVLKITKSKTQ